MSTLKQTVVERDHSKIDEMLVGASEDDTEKIGEAYKLLTYVPNPGLLGFHKDTRSVKLVLGGNRSGKTVLGCVEVAFWALGVHPYLQDYIDDKWERPLHIRICCTSYNQGIKGIIVPTIREWFPPGSYEYKADPPMIYVWDTHDSGDRTLLADIELMSFDQDLDKFGGQSKHLIWMDEEASQKIYRENMMRLLDMDGHMMITMTPIHGMSWTYEELYLSPKTDKIGVYHARTLDNPHLSKEAIIKIKDMINDKDEEAVRLYGEFIPQSHFIYPKFREYPHIVDPLSVWKDGRIPDDWMIVLGIDPHDRAPHGVVFLGIDRDSNVYVYDEILQHCLINELAQAIKVKLNGRRPAYAMIDSSANTESSIAGRSIIQELAQPGNDIHTLSTKKGRASVLEGIQTVRDYLNFTTDEDGKVKSAPRLKIFSTCVELLREFRLYVWDNWKGVTADKRDPKEAPMKKNDHLLDALRYALMTQPMYRHPALTKALYEGYSEERQQAMQKVNRFTGM